MAKVDPYVQPLPRSIVDKNGEITPEFQQWLVYDNRWKFDMWIRSGGGTDAISDADQENNHLAAVSVFRSALSFAEKRIAELENSLSGLSSMSSRMAAAEKRAAELEAVVYGFVGVSSKIESLSCKIDQVNQESSEIRAVTFKNSADIREQLIDINNIRQVI